MTTQFTVDDSSSFQCFCGNKICCCRFLNYGYKPSINIMHQLRLEEQKQMIRQLQLRQTLEKKRNRKAIFSKRQSRITELEKSDKKILEVGSSHNLPFMPLFETKRTIKRSNSPAKTHRIFTNNNNQDACNNTTILFDPHSLPKYESSMELESLNIIQTSLGKGFISADESKLMLEEFLQSEIFGGINQKITTSIDNSLPQIIRKYGQIVSTSVNINRISLKMVEQQKQKLFQCIQEGKTLTGDILTAIQQIQRYLNSKDELLNNFNMVNFIGGSWLPNWSRLQILLPKTQFVSQNKSLRQCEQLIQTIQLHLNRSKQDLLNTFLDPQLYVKVRQILFLTLLHFKQICSSLYLTVRNNRVSFHYQTAYRFYTQKLQIDPSNKLMIKSIIKQRQLHVTKLKYLKDIHDLMWVNDVGALLLDKTNKDINYLKRQYYNKSL